MRRVALLALTLAALGLVAAGCVTGPYWGRVELVGDPDATDVVVVFACDSQFGFHHGALADREYRRVRSGETFVFPWMWRGLIPDDCSLHAIHPLYESPPRVHTERRAGNLGTLRLESWRAVLENAFEIPMVEGSAWSHSAYLHRDYLRGFWPASSRRSAARFAPEVREIFHEIGTRLPARFGADWAVYTRRELRGFEREIGYEPPVLDRQIVDCIASGESERIADLVAAGGDPDAWDDEGYTPLLRAAEAGDLAAARSLLDAGADPNRYQEGGGLTPLVAALERRKFDVARFLIERGARAGASTWKGSPLSAAVRRHAPRDLIESILASGGLEDPLESSRAVCMAAAKGPDDLLARLLDAGAPLQQLAQGEAPLLCAVRWGTPERVRALLARGADPNARDWRGRSALDLARAHGRTENAAVLEGVPRSHRAEGKP